MKVYRDKNDWWVGYYRGPEHHYVCPLPTLVIRWRRKFRTVMVFRSRTEPKQLIPGDLWINPNPHEPIKAWDGKGWVLHR